MNVPKDSRNEENTVQYSQESKDENLIPNTRVSESNPEQIPTSNVARSRSTSNCRALFLPNTHGIHSTTNIPKHITTFDEKYVLRCLELLHNCALRSAASNFDSKVHFSPDDSIAKLDIDIPSVTSSPSMINILNSPLLQKSGSADFNYSKPVSPPRHKRFISVSSTYTSCSDKSSSSGSANSFQGILTCTLKDGLPQYAFSADDKSDVYIASLSRARPGPPNDNTNFDYVYTFSMRRRKKLELQSVGTMRVSTSISSCSENSSEVKETRFVLSLSNDDPADEMEISNYDRKTSRKLKSKVAKVFKSSHSYNKRRPYESSAIFEDFLWDPPEDHYYTPSLELAAVILKDVRKNREEEDEVGGWGLKFLKKPGKDASLDSVLHSECTTSLSVLIPAGIHGGPRTRGGGPSSLAERWVSGGQCDCGGWDIGCPLTVLNVGPSRTNTSSLLDNSSIDLFVQGSKEDFPMFKMANINEGLYYIHFQSTLSTLQSFAIAAAIIHSRSPVLRSKVYRS